MEQEKYSQVGQPSQTDKFGNSTPRALNYSPEDINYVIQYASDERVPFKLVRFWLVINILLWAATFYISGGWVYLFYVLIFIAVFILSVCIRGYFAKPSANVAKVSYEIGSLIPGIVVKESPLTIMTLIQIPNPDNAEEQQRAIQTNQFKGLPSQSMEVGTRVPCCAVFGVASRKKAQNVMYVFPVDFASEDKILLEKALQAIPEEEWLQLERYSQTEEIPLNQLKAVHKPEAIEEAEKSEKEDD